MNGPVRAPVVVGVDGSPEARAAVDFGAREAERRHVPLRLVHGYRPTVAYGPTVAVPHDPAVGSTETVVRVEADRIRRDHPELPVASVVIVGDPGLILLAEAAHATLVVVGSRGLGSFHSLLLGSVSGHVAAHAQVPVVVVRPTAPDARGVVVGIDGSADALAAVEFGYAEAAARGTHLTAVYAGGDRAEADRLLTEALAGWAEKYPDVDVVRRAVFTGHPVRAFIEESGYAELLVVARPGPVSDGVVHHARVPVAVVPG